MGRMGEVRNRVLHAIGEETRQLVEAERVLAQARERLHTLIRVAGNEALGKDEKAGPSAIARATAHRYTREYVGTLLKSPMDGELAEAWVKALMQEPPADT